MARTWTYEDFVKREREHPGSVSGVRVVTRTLENPWRVPEHVSASRCWCCHKDFTETEPVKVIDSVDPKLVHDAEPCASAMIQMVQGQ